jgi:hypothetical protein
VNYIGIGLLVDRHSRRSVRTVNDSDTAHNATFGNGFPDLRRNIVKIFPLGG